MRLFNSWKTGLLLTLVWSSTVVSQEQETSPWYALVERTSAKIHVHPKQLLDRTMALSVLLNTDVFAGAIVGANGQRSKECEAFRLVLQQSDAKYAFHRLLDEGSDAGKLYALCGLYLTDSELFREKREQFATRKSLVNVRFGCREAVVSFGSIVAGQDKGHDIVNGGLPQILSLGAEPPRQKQERMSKKREPLQHGSSD